MTDPEFNYIASSKASRRARTTNDLYALTLQQGGHLGVRIAVDDAVIGGMQGMYVVYVYRSLVQHLHEVCGVSKDPRHLLLAPLVINRSAWTAGYLTFVASGSDCAGALLEEHVFVHPRTQEIFDAHGAPTRPRHRDSPVGMYAVNTAWGLDVEVGKAIEQGRLVVA